MDPNIALQAIWARSEGDYVFAPMMKNGVWFEAEAVHPTAYEAPGPGISGTHDVYFSPLRYIGPTRRKGMLGRPGVIYADLDGDHVEEPRLPPSVVIVTSDGHYHAYWFLDEPAEPIEWERRAKAWSQEIGADPGGWDATQVLRVPETINHKYGTSVYIQTYRPERVYKLTDFPETEVSTGSVAQAEPVPSKRERDYLIKAGIEDDRLPLSARYWLTASPAQIQALGKIDRSKVMWQVEKALYAANYSPYEVYNLMYFSAINKFAGRPDRLWHEVNKAAAP